jgi:hypothetical protein
MWGEGREIRLRRVEWNMLKLPSMCGSDEMTEAPSEAVFVLPKHVRFARSLALVSVARLRLRHQASQSAGRCGAGRGPPPA